MTDAGVLEHEQPATTVPAKSTVMRPYTQQDIPALVALVTAVLPTLPTYAGLRVDEARVRFLLEQNQHNATFLCLVLCDSQSGTIIGGVAGYCTPTMFSFDTVATDTFLYVAPAYRTLRNTGRLIKAYVDWAKARKASLILATHTAGLGNDEKMAQLLGWYGFHHVGALYQWRQK